MTDPWPAPPRPDLPARPSWAGTGGSWAAASADGPPRRGGPRVAVALATAVVVIAAALWFVLLRPSGPNGPAVALAVSFAPRHDVRYAFTMSMDGTVSVAGRSVDLSMSFDARLRLHPVTVGPDGVATVRVTANHLVATVNGNHHRARTVHYTVRLARDGRVVGGGSLIPSEGSSTALLQGSGQLSPLPDHPVHVGDTWTEDFEEPFPIGHGTVQYSSSNELARYKRFRGTRDALVESHSTTDLTGDDIKASDFLAAFGGTQRLPPGVDPTLSVEGSAQVFQTVWIDPQRELLVKVAGSGTTHVTVELSGLPGGRAGPGEIQVDGDISMAMERLG